MVQGAMALSIHEVLRHHGSCGHRCRGRYKYPRLCIMFARTATWQFDPCFNGWQVPVNILPIRSHTS